MHLMRTLLDGKDPLLTCFRDNMQQFCLDILSLLLQLYEFLSTDEAPMKKYGTLQSTWLELRPWQ